MLQVKKLSSTARMPEVAHAGHDLGYDLFASEDVVIPAFKATAVPTGLALRYSIEGDERVFGLVVKDRSSMAIKGLTTLAGVIDAGYTGEVKIILSHTDSEAEYCDDASLRDPKNWNLAARKAEFRKPKGILIKAGTKIAQLLPQEVLTEAAVVEVEDFAETARGDGGFGSTGA